MQPPAWKIAVEEELKATRIMVLNKLFSQKFAKHFIRSKRNVIFFASRQQPQDSPKVEKLSSETGQRERLQDSVTMTSPEVEKVKKVLNFDENTAAVQPPAVETDQPKEVKVKVIPLLSRESFIKRQYRLKEFSVSLKRLKPRKCYLIDKGSATSKCFVEIQDLKHHKKWGKVIANIAKMSKCDSIELDINKNLSPKSAPHVNMGKPNCSSTPMKKVEPAPSPVGSVEKHLVHPSPGQASKPKTPSPMKGLDLFQMQCLLDEGAYDNVLDFHLDIKKVRDSARIGGPAKKSILVKFDEIYHQSMKEFCPWFDFENPIASFEPKNPSDNVSIPPTSDHHYAAPTFNSNRPKVSEQNLVSLWRRKYQRLKDFRTCVLCSYEGDADHDRAGRLLYIRQNEWVHVK